MSNKEIIGKRIASLMKKAKISQHKLAEILKDRGAGEVTQATISNWTLGHTSAPLELAPVFCEIFSVSLYDLFGTQIEDDRSKKIDAIELEFDLNPDHAFNKLVKEYASLLETAKEYRKDKDGAQKRLNEIYSVYKKQLESEE